MVDLQLKIKHRKKTFQLPKITKSTVTFTKMVLFATSQSHQKNMNLD